MPLANGRDHRSVDDHIDAILTNIVGDDCAAPTQPWGGKLGFSVYDEEEVLGPHLAYAPDYNYASDDDDDLDSEEEEDDVSEQEYEFNDSGAGAFAKFVDAYAPVRLDELPRAARLIKPLCQTYRVDRSLVDTCAICLEGLARGESAWRLPCLHAFHEICMVRYLAGRRVAPTCPMCRYEVKQCAAQSVA